jgi:ABC-type oligopeptide transport system substrate-binding subunit
VRKGNAQIFYWGWHADYPDPENFLFLLHGPQGKVKTQGENASNWVNADFDRLFERMKNMENGPERQKIIDAMLEIARREAPWLWGMHPVEYGLEHVWMKNRKPSQISNNLLKYQRIDAVQRATLREQWNAPILWPLGLLAAVIVSFIVPAVLAYRRRERGTARGDALVSLAK